MDARQLYQRRHEGILGMLLLGMLEEGTHLQVVLDHMIDDPHPHQICDIDDNLGICVFLLDEGGLDILLEISSDFGVLSFLPLDVRVVEALLDRLFPLEMAAGVIEELLGGTFGA